MMAGLKYGIYITPSCVCDTMTRYDNVTGSLFMHTIISELYSYVGSVNQLQVVLCYDYVM